VARIKASAPAKPASTLSVPTKSTLTVNVFDGTRRPFVSGKDILYRIIDGNQNQILLKEVPSASLTAKGLPFYDNAGDNYSVIVSADGYRQSGFVPVKLSPQQPVTVELMLVPKDPQFNFADAPWDSIKTQLPFIADGVSDADGKDRYGQEMETKPKSLASLFNLTTAMKQIFLPKGTPLDYLKQIIWDDTFAQDRFFAWCDPALIDQVKQGELQGQFAREPAPWLFHPGSTSSWKQIQFGEANVQLTFHEQNTKKIGNQQYVMIEPDIDYYKDLGAHGLLEVLPNDVTHGLTDPVMVYVLRWIAGRRAGIPEFNPPYVIV
jgi:hypothetical protein